MLKVYSSPIYRNLPPQLQDVFVTAKGMCYAWMRNGFYPGKLRRILLANEKLSDEQLRDLQFRELRSLIEHADRNVPYYRRVFKEAGFRPGDLKSIADLTRLPTIDKRTVQEHHGEFLAGNYRRKLLISGKTGGTTGSSLKLKMDTRLIHLEKAFIMRQYRWAGFPRKMGRCACLRGDVIVPAEVKKPPYWRYDAWNREMWYSSFHLAEETAAHYIEGLEKFDPHSIFAFPSAIFALSRLILEIGIKPRLFSLKGIITSSEFFPEYQKEIVRKAFGSGVFDYYGQFERVTFIGTCEYGNYHIFPDYGITELLPAGSDGEDTAFQLVGTGFLNRAMPLIRYLTGDTIVPDESTSTCGCGRHFQRIKSIHGRMDDLLLTPDGRRVILVHAFKNARGIRCAQILQEVIDKITVKVVREPGYTDADDAGIIKSISERVGSGVQIDIRQVNQIPLEKNGKFKMVISKLAQGIPPNHNPGGYG